MKTILSLILFFATMIPITASLESSVEDQGEWIIVTTVNETGEPFPTVWALRKSLIQSIDFSDTEPVRSSADHNQYVGRIVRLRITTTELITTGKGASNKQYESLWIDIDRAQSLMRGIVAALNNKAEQAGAGQPAARSQSKSSGSDKPQPDSEGSSR